MPRQREVKPWTIYPPTQEDRDIIEQKAAEASLSVSAYLCMVGKLANVKVSLPSEQQALSEKTTQESEPEQVSNPVVLVSALTGEPLPTETQAFLHKELVAGRINILRGTERQDFEEINFLQLDPDKKLFQSDVTGQVFMKHSTKE